MNLKEQKALEVKRTTILSIAIPTLKSLGYEVQNENNFIIATKGDTSFGLYFDFNEDIKKIESNLRYSYTDYSPKDINKELYYFAMSQKYLSNLNIRNINDFVTSKAFSQVAYIGQECFRGEELKGTLSIPASVKYIGMLAFQGCFSLDKIDFSNTDRIYLHPLVFYNVGIKELELPKNVIAFELNICGCNRLTSLALMCSLDTLKVDLCKSLVNINIQNEISNMYLSNTPATNISWGEGLKSFGIDNVGIEELILPDTVNYIQVLCDCKKLRYVDLKNVTSYKPSVLFMGCPNIKQIKTNNIYMREMIECMVDKKCLL